MKKYFIENEITWNRKSSMRNFKSSLEHIRLDNFWHYAFIELDNNFFVYVDIDIVFDGRDSNGNQMYLGGISIYPLYNITVNGNKCALVCNNVSVSYSFKIDIPIKNITTDIFSDILKDKFEFYKTEIVSDYEIRVNTSPSFTDILRYSLDDMTYSICGFHTTKFKERKSELSRKKYFEFEFIRLGNGAHGAYIDNNNVNHIAQQALIIDLTTLKDISTNLPAFTEGNLKYFEM